MVTVCIVKCDSALTFGRCFRNPKQSGERDFSVILSKQQVMELPSLPEIS